MKNILVPTDFSRNALISAYYAAAFARISGARLIIFHAFYPLAIPAATDAAALEKVDALEDSLDPEADAQQQLDALAFELHKRFGVSVTRLLKPGFALDEIPSFTQRVNADLVVMGIQGSNLQVNGALGKVAGLMLLSESVPVICVPAEAAVDPEPQLQQLLQELNPLCNEGGLHLLQSLAYQSGSDVKVVGE